MSKWTHNMCDPCWVLRRGEDVPFRMNDATDEKCCYCGMNTTSGIYVREDPKNLICKGKHA